MSARLSERVILEAQSTGAIVAWVDDYPVDLGAFSAAAADHAKDLRAGLPLASFASGRRPIDKEIDLLVRRLAVRGLLEYRLGDAPGAGDQIIIEPQVADYWPQMPKLGDFDVIALSRFAYMRRRGSDLVLESPRAGALFRICDPKIATAIALLSAPRQVGQFRRQPGFPGIDLLALLVDSRILFKVDAAGDSGLRSTEGDRDLVLWDFHDLLFHARSTEGRHANPLGGVYPYVGVIPPLPAVRPPWPGRKIDLRQHSTAHAETPSRLATLLRERHSVRDFDDARPITLAELARLLDGTACVVSTWKSGVDEGSAEPLVEYTLRPYPSGGASYGLELYLVVNACEGLARGFYHYDAGEHALTPIDVPAQQLDATLRTAAISMGAPAAPQILIMIAARFGRVSWKYGSIAYALIQKDVGVLLQTLYLMATDMRLGGCAIGSVNIELFAKMTGIEFHAEGPVGQFAIGRGTASEPSG